MNNNIDPKRLRQMREALENQAKGKKHKSNGRKSKKYGQIVGGPSGMVRSNGQGRGRVTFRS